MKSLFFLACCLLYLSVQSQTTWSGVYTFNKGINKDQGSIYIQQFKPDSAFFYLNFISAMPDFNMFALKGFIAVQDQAGRFESGDSLRIQFTLQSSQLILRADTFFRGEQGVLTKYKKTSSSVKKNSTVYIDYAEKYGSTKTDSTMVFDVPHSGGKMVVQLKAKTEVKIIDSFGAFYLIELPDKLKEFLWVSKKSLTLIKK